MIEPDNETLDWDRIIELFKGIVNPDIVDYLEFDFDI